ncbi:hypothetical protein AAHZ94_26680 [Streptomyces sp. HSW2009]|uniref:hypothetical protein n=1 Tax=Streptomyces sp. HSW2009 TaxID=3142890 RepID=UPI0032EBC2E4
MTQRDERRRDLRIWLPDAETDRDVSALCAWLEREQLLEEWARLDLVRIDLRPAPAGDGDGHPMGSASEVLIVVIGALAQPALDDLYAAVKQGIAAWRDNRRQVEGGDPPEVRDGWTDDTSDSDAEDEE